MKSIVLAKSCLLLAVLLNFQEAFCEVLPPNIVQDPVFGLRYRLAHSQLDRLPREVINTCDNLVTENVERHSWVFAQLSAGDARYFILGGYWMRHDPVPKGFAKYESDKLGVLLKVRGERCELIATAIDSLTDFDEPEPPQAVREGLAADLRVRLAKASGGDRQLMRALKRPPAELMRESTALRHAFQAP